VDELTRAELEGFVHRALLLWFREDNAYVCDCVDGESCEKCEDAPAGRDTQHDVWNADKERDDVDLGIAVAGMLRDLGLAPAEDAEPEPYVESSEVTP